MVTFPTDVGPADFERIAASLRTAAERLTRSEPLPGGVIVVATRAATVGILPFGAADIAARQNVTGEHLFEIGSISKFLVAVAVCRLAEDGAVRLDDPVTTHLPWLQAGPRTADITLTHLLNHTAGLVAGVDGLADELAQCWQLRNCATFPPGQRFYYSNAGYVMLGLVIAAATGRPLADYLQRHILTPIGAGTGIAAIRSGDRGRLAVGYAPAVDDRPWHSGDALAPATWLEAVAGDGCVALDGAGAGGLLRLLLSDGTVDGRRVLSTGSMARIVETLAPAGEPVVGADGPGAAGLPVTDSRYGLGINVETIDGKRCLTHGGGMVGYASFVLADPANDVAVAVLTNANGDCLAAQVLARYAHRLLATGGAASPDDFVTDPAGRAAGRIGALAGNDRSGVEVPVRLTTDPVSGLVHAHAGGQTGTVFRDLYGRYSTNHPHLRDTFLHDIGGESVAPADPPGDAALVGHYRSHNPWFTNFRIVARGRGLFLTTTGGVEAPTSDEPLIALGGGVYRIGAEEWRPERLTVLARVAGHVVLVDRDGCQYSAATVLPIR